MKVFLRGQETWDQVKKKNFKKSPPRQTDATTTLLSYKLKLMRMKLTLTATIASINTITSYSYKLELLLLLVILIVSLNKMNTLLPV